LSSQSSSPEPELKELSQALAREQNPILFEADSVKTPKDHESECEVVSFRLFRATNSKDTGTREIRVRSPSLTEELSGLLRPERPKTFYFADDPSHEDLKRLKESAVNGPEVLARSKWPWPGCALPWRVTSIDSSGDQHSKLTGGAVTNESDEEHSKRRVRPGKKHRIAKRVKLAAVKATEMETERLAVQKEEEEREKRTRRNREKKVKKRAREKAKKASGIIDT
jgi:hypothetical protein